MKKQTVIVADDHPFFRNGIRNVIEQTDKWEVISEAHTGQDAIDKFNAYLPSIIVLDISMGEMSGFQVVAAIIEQHPSAVCVMMTMHNNPAYCHKALKLGAKGYLVKEDVVQDMIICFETAISGEIYISKHIPPADEVDASDFSAPETSLSQRELDILHKIASLKVNKIIARELNISVSTVQNHRHNICQKIGLTGRQALLQYAIEWVNSRK